MSNEMGFGILIAGCCLLIVVSVGGVSYDLAEKSLMKEIKHYGCEKAVAFHEVNK